MDEVAINSLFNEQDRLRLVEEMAADDGPDWAKPFEPGSFGCHELLDRTNLVGDIVEESILNHPACLGNPDWFATAERAVTALRELYQRIGQDHPSSSDVRAVGVAFEGQNLSATLADGRTITVPIAWFPRLGRGTPEEREHWLLSDQGAGITWPDLEEAVSVEDLLSGRPRSGDLESSEHRPGGHHAGRIAPGAWGSTG